MLIDYGDMSPPSSEVPYGALDLMVLKTLDTLGPQHGYGIARRIEQMAEGMLALNQGTIYPALLRLEQKGWDRQRLGHEREQPACPLLLDHPRGKKATCHRSGSVVEDGGDDEQVARGIAVMTLRAILMRVRASVHASFGGGCAQRRGAYTSRTAGRGVRTTRAVAGTGTPCRAT